MEMTGKFQRFLGLGRLFVRKADVSEKREVNTRSLKIIGASGVLIFIAVVFLLPEESTVEFREETKRSEAADRSQPDEREDRPTNDSARALWGSPVSPGRRENRSSATVNHNVSTILGPKGGNARTQIRAGVRLPLRVVDKFIVSQDPVPILAELMLPTLTDSGLSLPAGTRFYGEASFEKGSDRARIGFRQISTPNGDIRSISGIALGKDGQPGLSGRVYSDGVKNTAGQVLTTFVGGLAEGSISTDELGRSKGGLENGLLRAVSVTAKDRAQAYGEKLKAEREWIEVEAGVECDALLNESLSLHPEGQE